MLTIVSTPIGHLGDLSPRAGQTLEEADIIACEDTRMTRKLISLCGLSVKADLLAYHDHNGAQMRPRLIAALKQGKRVALVSDAGTPLISDPGFKLVCECHQQKIQVTAAPGPSSPIVALSVSGLPSDKFIFHGFVPTKHKQARQQISQSAPLTVTQIWMEVPKRLAATLSLMHQIYGERQAVIARELTKLHEEIDKASLAQLADKYHHSPPPKGELIVLVSGAEQTDQQHTEDQINSLLYTAMQSGSVKDAVKEVEALSGWPRRQLYQMALVLDKKS